MTGRDLFESTRDIARALDRDWPTWEQLSNAERLSWDEMAHEQIMRDLTSTTEGGTFTP